MKRDEDTAAPAIYCGWKQQLVELVVLLHYTTINRIINEDVAYLIIPNTSLISVNMYCTGVSSILSLPGPKKLNFFASLGV